VKEEEDVDAGALGLHSEDIVLYRRLEANVKCS
jgi:hypothetical protein